MDVTVGRLPVLTRAALVGSFDPRSVLDTDDDLGTLAAVSVEKLVGDAWLWVLTDDARQAGLARIPPPGPDRDALLAEVAPMTSDGPGRALQDLLAEKPEPVLLRLMEGPPDAVPREPGIDRLLQLFQARELLTSAGVVLPQWAAGEDAARHLQRAILHRRRSGASQAVLPDTFRGRTRELAALRLFATTGRLPEEPGSVVRRVPQAAQQDPRAVPALAVSGIGGTGKSATIEQLRRILDRSDEVTLIAFDLDKTALRTGDSVALTLELLRQFGLLHPGVDAEMSRLRGDIRRALADSVGNANVEIGGSAVFNALSGLGEVGVGAAPITILIDTFEEALVLGTERVRLIADWLGHVRDLGRFSALRTVLAGRSADILARVATEGLALAGVIELGELGARAGQSKLRDMFRRLGVPHEALVPRLIAAFGSNPLVIEILAQFCQGKAEADIEALIDDSDSAMRAGLDAEMRQRFLYTRILERLSDPEVRPLASPGLVLRRITVQQIAKLLAEPCGLPVPMPDERARDLFEKLAAEAWLVRAAPGAGDTLEHLPDLRRLMLPQVLADPAAKAVATAAAVWFETGPGSAAPLAALEALYYRALIDADALPDDPATLRALADFLGTAASDLPAAAQARLREATGRVLRLDEMAHLNEPARQRAASNRRSAQNSMGLEKSVLTELRDGVFTEISSLAEHFTSDFAENLLRSFRPTAPLEAVAPLPTAAVQAPAPEEAAWLPPPELVQSMFAAGSFDELARIAAPVAIALLQDIIDRENAWRLPDTLHHPAYLCALSALASDQQRLDDFALRLAEWLEADGRRSALEALLERAPRLAEGEGSEAVAVMVLKLAGVAVPSLPTPELSAIKSVAAWRVWLASGPPTLESPLVALPVLSLFDPEIIAPGAKRDRWLSVRPPDSLDEYAALRFRKDPMRLRELTHLGGRTAPIAVSLRSGGLPRSSAARLVPGRRSELHAPLRALLDRRDEVPGLVGAVARIADEIAWWPVDLAPTLFTTDPGSTTMLTLVDTADKFGRLPQLVEDLARAPGADPGFAGLDPLMARFGTVWASRLTADREADAAQPPQGQASDGFPTSG